MHKIEISKVSTTHMFTQHFRCNLKKVASKALLRVIIENILDNRLILSGKMLTRFLAIP